MGETRFTKGPWSIRAEFNVNAGRRGIASTGGHADNTRDPEQLHRENVANAHLIASAPDLYAALEKMMPLRLRVKLTAQEEAAWNEASAALQRARGEG